MTSSTPTTPPLPAQPVAPYRPTGAEILHESWRLIRLTPWVFVLPFVVLLIAAVAESTVVTVLARSPSTSPHSHLTAVIFTLVIVGVAVAIPATIVQALGLIAISATADGRDAGPAASLRTLKALAAPLLAWAVLSVIVGAFLRTLGRVIPFGSLAQIAGGIGWGASTFLALPVMITERCGPGAAIRRSSRMLGKAWRPVLRSVVRTAWRLLATIPLLLALFIGGAVIFSSQPGSGAERAGQLTVTIAITLLIAVNLVIAGILTAARLTIYRHVAAQSR